MAIAFASRAISQIIRFAPAYEPESGAPTIAAPLDIAMTRLPGAIGTANAACNP
ncbi:hypothetical protein AKJ09_06890 [Labilithrix luteola]|uniref:Uncharacterized protein n=1 Tax=Labilithrix luteola TaxID=1391654 RepID=A0A0K1Q3M9_9BACT|nr:hypothetical protein AKJ09_06890 [Labilithrix luteola]